MGRKRFVSYSTVLVFLALGLLLKMLTNKDKKAEVQRCLSTDCSDSIKRCQDNGTSTKSSGHDPDGNPEEQLGTSSTEMWKTRRESSRLPVENQPTTEGSAEPTTPAMDQPSGRSRLKNVLFIIVDDLRPQLGAYHDPQWPDYFSKLRIRTPNLDRLATRSLVFKQAYAQYSLCGPSRASLLTSRRPDVTRVYDNVSYWRRVGGNFTTLPQHFKNNGYVTVGLGKVFHPGRSSGHDDPPSWTESYYKPPFTDRKFMPSDAVGGWRSVSPTELGNVPLMDESTTRMAKSVLSRLAAAASTDGRPFFVAVGYSKPHLHMVCPQRFFDLYPLEDEHGFLANASWQTPVVRPHGHFDGAVTASDGRRVLPSEVLRQFRRAYFACISYVDELVGRLLNHVTKLGLDDNTIVSFMADHGYHLGENGQFGKITTRDFANRVPLMIRVPGLTDAGLVTSAVVESVDVMPTLVEAAGLRPIVRCPADCAGLDLCTQGVSLLPLFRRPDAEFKDAAFSQIMLPDFDRYTIRTSRFRLVDRAREIAHWPNDYNHTKLYDHNTDPLEQTNVAHNPRYSDVVKDLRHRLHEFYVNRRC